jgi:phage terminase large subunit-like protein
MAVPATATKPYAYGRSYVDLELARKSFRWFVGQAWSIIEPAPLVWTWGMEAICEHLSWVTTRQIRFLMINIPPRQSKSTLCSVLWPAWEWIDNPGTQYLTGSYAIQLAQRDAAKSRRLIKHKWYQEAWGKRFAFTPDEDLKRQYSNDRGGRRVVTSTDSAVTGEGGNRVIIDDPHNVRDVESETQREAVADWWDNAMSSRLNQINVDSWMVIGQRTHEDDLFGHILNTDDMDDVVHLVLPNEYDDSRKCITYGGKLPKGADPKKEVFKPVRNSECISVSQWRRKFEDPRTKRGQLLNEERLNREAIRKLRKRFAGGNKYELQYQQDPKGGGGKILKREFWQLWEGEPPECEQIIQVWDTALQSDQEADYSAYTEWGLFKHRPWRIHEDTKERYRASETYCLILLGGDRFQIPYYELRKIAKKVYDKSKPDMVLIEQKVSGISLIQDFRRGRMRVKAVKIDHGGKEQMDIKVRAELAAPVLVDGLVYAPKTSWADDIKDECAKVPGGRNDDWATTVCMALMFLRRRLEEGEWEEDKDDVVRLFKRSKKRGIYG